ncbi:MAG: hypothetical protein ACPGYS_02785 [Flavobacteriales bacterium]
MSAFFRFIAPDLICRSHAPIVTLGLWLMVAFIWAPCQVCGQRDVSPEEVKAEAMQAFEQEEWELAHRRMAELLSLDGTDVFLQMRYAATLLHDVRTRDEGIQRLASLADAGNLQGEGWYWWGRAWMLQGEPQLAETALLKALDEADKKSPWRDACSLALAQSREMPLAFAERQALQKLDAVSVPVTSFHRYIQWERQGVRVMLAPQQVHSKLDKKSDLSAPVTFWRGEKELFCHSLGAKGARGLEICIATLDDEGAFSETTALPGHVNSPYDDLNPVWDPSTQCLVFASNRPGTVGGFDLFQTCRQEGVWSMPNSLGPMFNSVHDDLAYFAPFDEASGWLVTGRQGEYGGVEVWEVSLDGAPWIPVNLNTQWAVSGEVVPGTMTLADAQTNETLAVVGLEQERGQWNVVVGAGQVLRYSFESTDGDIVEGTYAVPHADVPSSVTQSMVMTTVDGAPFLDARPLTQEAVPNPDLAWGWDLVLDQIHEVEVEAWEPQQEVVQEAVVAQAEPERRVVQFQSYPWWTDVQKEERAIAASMLSKHVAPRGLNVPKSQDFDALPKYRMALEQAQQDVMSEAVASVLSVAAKEVIVEETPWEEALAMAMKRASSLWPVGSINLEEVARKAKRAWARSGTLYDQGALPDVRDKRGLVGDGQWIEDAWNDGRVAKLSEDWRRMAQLQPQSVKLAWCLAHDPEVVSSWEPRWFSPEVWDEDAIRSALTSETITAPLSELDDIRTRLSMIEMMEPSAQWSEADRAQAIRAWKGLAVTAAAQQGDADEAIERQGTSGTSKQTFEAENATSKGKAASADSEAVSASELGSSDAMEESLDAEWRGLWLDLQMRLSPSHEGAEGADAPVLQGALSWQASLASWMAVRLEENEALSPRVMLRDVIQHFDNAHDKIPSNGAASEEEDAGSFQGDGAWEAAKKEMLEMLLEQGEAISNAEEACQGLEAAWVLSSWAHNSDWKDRSPEQVQALLPAWPQSVQQKLENLRIQWAQRTQSEPAAANTVSPSAEVPADSDDMTDSSQPQVTHAEAETSHVVTASEQGQPEGHATTESSDVTTQLSVGAKGVHMGWFRNNPQVQSLPKGTTLDAQEGANGLKRWVLVMPENASAVEVQSIENWLMQQGIVDAYEVFRGVDGWSTTKPSSEDVVLNEGQTTSSTSPPPSPQTQTEDEDDTEKGKNASATERESNAASASGAENASSTSNEGAANESAEESPNPVWGSDDMWSHGAPVALGNLRGTWYAVQVGAFRGTPEKEWIEQAGERLIYEPFPDGLARWYAGVRQDRLASTSRKEELQEYDAFADAFVVRLRDGVREVVTPEEVSREEYALETLDAAPEAAASSASEENAELETSDEESETFGRVETQASPALVASDVVDAGETATWHVDIAKYYGTVPSKDVASLLFKAADWGVRSVQLFGQTTYFTRSMDDFGEAERLLAAIRSEGFTNATLVQE